MLDDLDDGRLADSRQPLERYLAGWLERTVAVSRRGRPLAPTTRSRYAEAVAHASREIGKVRLVDLRPAHVEAFRDALLARGMAPETVSGHLRVVCQALARAEAQELIKRNPADPKLVNAPCMSESRTRGFR